ncbi:50S ribosomal protein L25/general stress protein Ctc [Leptolyngbya iicbica]|uniref:Large ribosomal subunit protein bL25 n=2 Tax=Cyanophyceae TaxID=3028117 RepID=A0A4Q7EGF6_9CYAN|nr:50S ribosomal protein L25/general stress protein Ctc [Leptolyngbya sp. LK]RZM82373.1 50S ribosomal protein L25/general stress protein Ctc [Leptolyngbya sp. LK]
MELSIECQKRDASVNPRALRREGQIPAVLYGHDGDASVALTVDQRSAERLVRSASINNTLINVSVPEMPWTGQALLREVQTHPWKDKLYHLSFFSIASQSSVDVVVPVHYVGTAKGVKDEGGTLDIMVSELAIRCAPGAIPESVDIDVSDLAVGENLHISNLKLPAGVEAIADTDKTLVNVAAPRTVASEQETSTTVSLLGTEPAAE